MLVLLAAMSVSHPALRNHSWDEDVAQGRLRSCIAARQLRSPGLPARLAVVG
jgi:hypothetical protein